MDNQFNEEFYQNFTNYIKKIMPHIYNITSNGLENIPKDQNYLLAGNHLHILDSFLLVTQIDDILRFMVDKKLYRYKLWKSFFSLLGTFPIDPNKTDIEAIKTSIKLLKEGRNVVIFPEGKTHKITEAVPFKSGVASLSKIASVPLIPFGINGSYIPGSNLHIEFGSPIDLSKYNKNEYDEVLETTVRKLEKKQ